MLNTFPSLLLPFLAPLVLRIGVALAFFYVAYKQYQRRGEISAIKWPVVGGNFVWITIVFHAAVGAMFLFGYYTQVAAILGAVGLLKGWWLNRRYPNIVILPTSTVVVLIVVCLSLVLSGAGAFAQDLPL